MNSFPYFIELPDQWTREVKGLFLGHYYSVDNYRIVKNAGGSSKFNVSHITHSVFMRNDLNK